MHTLVDGYNVLYAMPEFHDRSIGRDIEEGRKLLAERLMRYARVSGGRVTLVFDARGRDSETVGMQGTMRMAFSPDADEFIAEAVRVSSAPGSMSVVTSDRRLREEVEGLGARCEGPRRFLARVKKAVRGKGKDVEKPGNPTDEEVGEWLKEFGFAEDEGEDE